MECSTCRREVENANIEVIVVELEGKPLDPHEPFHFCSIFCRNVFINSNREHLKFNREYGNTLAKITTGIPG